MHPVFVCGIWMRQRTGHALLPAGCRFVGRFRTARPWPLVICGDRFAPVLLNEPGAGLHVTGEVIAVDDPGLTHLDLLEAIHVAGGPDRIAIEVVPLSVGPVLQAAAYVHERAGVGPIHAGPLAAYGDDARNRPADR